MAKVAFLHDTPAEDFECFLVVLHYVGSSESQEQEGYFRWRKETSYRL